MLAMIAEAGHGANRRYGAQQTDPRIFLGDKLQKVVIPAEPVFIATK